MHFVKAKGILASGSGMGMNLYRGCTHGCIYCDSRSRCYQITHDFEDIEVKENAPELLEAALTKKRRKQMIGTGSMCDPYMHCEEELRLTRRCLEIIESHGFGLTVLTKSNRILRDVDLLSGIHARAKCVAQMTLTTYDEKLCRIVEPNVSTTYERYLALKELQRLGIPTVVWLTPMLPFINDTEENLRGLLGYCFDAGVRGIVSFGMGLTLRDGDREYYYAALDRHFPGLSRVYAAKYGKAYELQSDNSRKLMALFHSECDRHGVLSDTGAVFRYLCELPETGGEQLRFI